MNSSGVDDSPSKALGSILTTIFYKGKRLCVSQSSVTVKKHLMQAMLKGSKADLSLPEAQSMVGWFCCFGPGLTVCCGRNRGALFSSGQLKSQRGERNEPQSHVLFKGRAPWASFIPLGSSLLTLQIENIPPKQHPRFRAREAPK